MNEIDWNNPDLNLDQILNENKRVDVNGNEEDMNYDDIDNEFSIEEKRSNENVSDVLLINNYSLNDFILYIKNKYNFNIIINDDKQNIKIYDNEKYLIGEIGIERLPEMGLNEHIRIKVDISSRGQGYGNILLELYKKAISEKGYKLPEFDYVRRKSLIIFLGKLGYNLQSQVLKGGNEMYLSEDEIELVKKKGEYDNMEIWYKMVLND